MREIEFRGKRIYNDEWIYGNLVVSTSGEKYIIENEYFSEDGHHLVCDSDLPVFTMQETIGQYTGLKDCNGTKIFEGDIIAVGEDEGPRFRYIIEWRQDCLAYLARQNGTTGSIGTGYGVDEWQVTGNIHDNPELLGGK